MGDGAVVASDPEAASSLPATTPAHTINDFMRLFFIADCAADPTMFCYD